MDRWQSALREGASKRNHASDYFVRRFENQNFLARGKSNGRVRPTFDHFDEVGIYYERFVIQARQLNHSDQIGRISLQLQRSGRLAALNGNERPSSQVGPDLRADCGLREVRLANARFLQVQEKV